MTLVRHARSVVGTRAVAVAPTPTSSLTDTFDGTASDLGAAWTLFTGSAYRSNGQAGSNASFFTARKDFDCGSPAMATQVDFVGQDDTGDRSVWVWVRFDASLYSGYALEVNAALDRFRVVRYVQGASTDVLGYTSVPGGVTPGAGRRVRLEVLDDTSGNPVLTAYWNGTKLASVTDTDAAKLRTGTRGGLGGYAWYDQIHVDNLTVAALSASAGSGGTGGSSTPTVTAILDTFDGSAAAGTISSSWTVPVGSWTRTSGLVIPNSGNVQSDAALYNAFSAPDGSQFAQVDFVAGDASVDRSLGVILRAPLAAAGSGAFTVYVMEANQAYGRVDLLRIVAGQSQGLTGFVTVSGGVTPAAGRSIRLEARNDTSGNVVLKGYWNGALVFTYTDGDPAKLTAGRYGGLFAYNSNGVLRGDNFRFGQPT